MREENKLFLALKGLIVGGTMLVPGMSGGSMAMILGIYDELVAAVSSFFRHVRASLIFLGVFCLGAGIGMLVLAQPLLQLIERFPKPAMYFFLGAVAGGVPLVCRQAAVRRVTWRVPVYIAAGLAVMALFSLFKLIPAGGTQTEMEAGVVSALLLLFSGLIAAVGLVLPGISVSYLLLLMGLYDETMRAISQLYFPFLIPFGVGLLLGIILTTRFLERAMTVHPHPTYLIILGFVLGSMAEVFPGIPDSWGERLVCLATLAAGFGAIWLLSWKERRNS